MRFFPAVVISLALVASAGADDADTAKQLVGTWRSTKDGKTGSTTFRADGTLTMSVAGMSFSGTYSVVKGQLRLTVVYNGSPNESPPVDILKLTEGELQIRGAGMSEVTTLKRFVLPADLKTLVGVWKAVNGGGSDFTYTFGGDGAASMQARMSNGKVGSFHGTFSVDQNTLHIELDSKFTYEIVKKSESELELRKPGEKAAETFKRYVPPAEVKKLAGIWKAVEDKGSGLAYTFGEDGTAAMHARLSDGTVATYPGTFTVENGTITFDDKRTYDIVKLTDTELELRRSGGKAGDTFKRYVPADNPEYVSWAKFPKGTRVTFRETSTFAERPVTRVTTETRTILDVTPTEVVIEYEMVDKQTGLGLKDAEVGRIKPRKESIPKAVSPADKVIDHTKKPEGATKDGGVQALKVGGVEIKAKWYEFARPAAKGQPAEVSKRWYSDQVPGVFVRFEHRVGGKLTQVWEVTEVKKP